MTHNEKVLELLSDGQPHSHHEGYRLHVMLHSRVADLRRKGHDIRCWREGDTYWYALRDTDAAGGLSSVSRSAGDHCTYPDAGVAEPPSTAPRSVPSPDSGAVLLPEAAAPEQLTLEAA